MQFKSLFIELTHQLLNYEIFWRDSAFYNSELTWCQQFPELCQAVLDLSEQEFELLDQSPTHLAEFLAHYIAGYGKLIKCIELPQQTQQIKLNDRLNTDVPGRKWAQIEAFAASLGDKGNADTIVDWCAGKSYLGRVVAYQWQANLHAIELQSQLCESGSIAASQWLKGVKFTCTDVLKEPHSFVKQDFVIALHACGDLHRCLVQQWLTSDSKKLVFAPCCYHQWLKGDYPALSKTAQQNDLSLSKNQVRLAVQEMVTAAARTRKQVNELGEWRMAFDLIQRKVRGVDEYMPSPSLPKSAASKGAEYVIRTLAQKKGIALDPQFDVEPYLKQAHTKYKRFQRLQLVSQGFRRAIELWLVLDLVLLLEEHDCEVKLNCFCDRQVTPRNIQVTATRR